MLTTNFLCIDNVVICSSSSVSRIPLQIEEIVSLFDGEILDELFLLCDEMVTEFFQLLSGLSLD